ncbi:hypothetical protein J3R83DRAFT_2374 [Lanmaoa asiatica]|nr:hypothetical protein J3R83DRAFT_2374 [Lanmaoa asiatica]
MNEQPNCVFFMSPRTFSRAQILGPCNPMREGITVEILDVMYDADDGRVHAPESLFTIHGNNVRPDIIHAVRNGEGVELIMFHDEDEPWRGVIGKKFAVVVVCPAGSGEVLSVEQDDVNVFAHFVAMYVSDRFHVLQRTS